MDIIGWPCNRELGKKWTSKKFMTERLVKRYENNYKKDGERIRIRETWESNNCDGKID